MNKHIKYVADLVPQKAYPETRIWVQIVYLGGTIVKYKSEIE